MTKEVYGSRICDIWSWWLPLSVTWGVAITIYFFLLTASPIPEVDFLLHTTSCIWSQNWKGFTSCVRDLCGPDLYIKLTNQSNCHVPIKELSIRMDLWEPFKDSCHKVTVVGNWEPNCQWHTLFYLPPFSPTYCTLQILATSLRSTIKSSLSDYFH